MTSIVSLVLAALVAAASATGLGAQAAKVPKAARRALASSAPAPCTSPDCWIQQATSDNAQLMTMSFDGLAFMTGSFNFDTFLPPGKVTDYFSFQYMRDADAAGMGHNTDFLTKIASSVLGVLSAAQIDLLAAFARSSATNTTLLATKRFPLMLALRQNMEGGKPAGAGALSCDRVATWSGSTLYALDGHLSYTRAQVLARVARSLSAAQKAALARFIFANSTTWDLNNAVVEAVKARMQGVPEGAPTVMGLAGDLASWMGGTARTDTYFCPERHAMYFGGFGFKTLPAKGKDNYTIDSNLTGDAGAAFRTLLTPTQQAALAAALEAQRPELASILTLRGQISAELRRLLAGGTASYSYVLSKSVAYGRADGKISCLYAKAFASIWATLSSAQLASMAAMRAPPDPGMTGPFVYATPVPSVTVGPTNYFFGL